MKQVILTFIICLSALCFSIMGMGWMVLGIFVIIGIYLFLISKLKPFIWLRKKATPSVITTTTGILILAIGLRIFLLEIYYIPSDSMRNTLLTGDKVLVSKLNYGPRMPRSPFEIPWINLFLYFKKEARTRADSTLYDYKRLKGYSKIKREDIAVFNFSHKKETYFIKRCIGLPGEALEIKNGLVICNRKKLGLPTEAIVKYRIWSNNFKLFSILTNSLNLRGLGILHNKRREKYSELLLNQEQYRIIKDASCIDSLSILSAKPDTIPHTYPHNERFLWTFENFGPVLIPKKGMQIKLTSDNYFLYKKVFDNYERQNFTFENNQVYDNGELIKYYTFKQDYYFMMGDNRHNSYDSRGWGFVPEEAIVGKAVLVLFSNDYSGFKWDRIFKIIK